jgi:hypothetical protein
MFCRQQHAAKKRHQQAQRGRDEAQKRQHQPHPIPDIVVEIGCV